jgi:putative SOS response-associated peptidase YedK
MCFTIEIHKTRTEIESRFNRKFNPQSDDFQPKYYISAFDYPKVPVVKQGSSEQIDMMFWGLIPAWVKDMESASKFRFNTLNAKAETLSSKPSFQKPLEEKKCLVIANGFFEWQHFGKTKTPYYIRMKDNSLFAFAGVYDEWVNIETGELFSGFSIITCEANPLLAKIHNSKKRMPVILLKDVEDEWIKDEMTNEDIKQLLQPINENKLEAYPISDFINSKTADKNSPLLIEKRKQDEQLSLF